MRLPESLHARLRKASDADRRTMADFATTDGSVLDGQASSLVIGEPQAPPAELLAEDAVLLAQEVDDLKLAGVDPGERAP